MTTYATPAVRAAAQRLAVDLSSVTGTGSGGRITVQDVRNAAPRRTFAAASSPASGLPEYAENPLLDAYSKSHPQIVAEALTGGPAPTLFEAGNLPSFTASGNDPQALTRLPWQARHAAAKADQAGWAAIFEKYANNGSDDDARLKAGRAAQPQQYGGYGDAPGNSAYAARMNSWLRTPGGFNSLSPEAQQARVAQHAAKNRADRAEASAREVEAKRKAATAATAKAEADRADEQARDFRRQVGR
jgi:hypothetical protein